MKIFTGKVVSKKMMATAVVEVERIIKHPLYGKRFKRIRKYIVHDEIGTKEGDLVHFVTCKPISKIKKWKITEVVSKDKKSISKVASEKGEKGRKGTVGSSSESAK